MTINRARTLLGKLAQDKNDQQIIRYITALDQIAKIAAKEAIKQFRLDKTDVLNDLTGSAKCYNELNQLILAA